GGAESQYEGGQGEAGCGPADAQGGMEAQGLLESHLASNLSEHLVPPVWSVEAREQFRAQLADISGAQGEHEVAGTGGFAEVVEDAGAIAIHVQDLAVTVGGDPVHEVLR